MNFHKLGKWLINLFKYVITVIIVLIIVVYVVSLQQVVGSSMESKYYDKDILILDKITYKITGLKRNDVISFKYQDTKYLIKRIIGMPGEHVEYKDNSLYINGIKYEDDITNSVTNDFTLEEISGVSVIPENMYLVLGDNRINSLDSRNFGLIKKEDIIGRVLIRIWPIIRGNR